MSYFAKHVRPHRRHENDSSTEVCAANTLENVEIPQDRPGHPIVGDPVQVEDAGDLDLALIPEWFISGDADCTNGTKLTHC